MNTIQLHHNDLTIGFFLSLKQKCKTWVKQLLVCILTGGLLLSTLVAFPAHALDIVWVEDAVPSGATQDGSGDVWNWISANPAPFSGSLAHQSALVSGIHQHYFYSAASTLNINIGDTLFTYVYLDPTHPPTEVMLQWHEAANGWEHRAYWGANTIPWGADGTVSRKYMGPLPAAGGRVRLDVPASAVGLEGITLEGMAFTLFDGQATWDRAGKTAASTTNVPPTVNLTSPTNGASYTGPAAITLSATAADSDGTVAKVEFYNGTTLLGTSTTAPYTLALTNVTAGSYTYTAKAYDNLGASTVSTASSISVKNETGGSNIYYIYADHLNTPRVITDTGNSVVWKWDSDPFGTDLPQEGTTSTGARFSYNLRFPGQYYDQETGLNYNGFRDYDSATGRYIQSDLIGLDGGINTYAYVSANPISFVDPLGLNLTAPGDERTGGGGGGEGLILLGIGIVNAIANLPSSSSIPAATSPTKDHCCTQYKNVYQSNSGKHGSTSRPGPRGTVGAEPINGPAVLATSVGAGNARIGYDPSTGQLVKFRLERTDEENCIKYWHGYVVSQTDLQPEDWRAGRNAGFPNWPRKPQ
jgi:RHS repeat-associated protein